jgi:hypothetical protein
LTQPSKAVLPICASAPDARIAAWKLRTAARRALLASGSTCVSAMPFAARPSFGSSEASTDTDNPATGVFGANRR